MPSKYIKKEHLDLIFQCVKDNQGITKPKMRPLIPIANYTYSQAISHMVKEGILIMDIKGSDRPLYTAEYVEANNIDIRMPSKQIGASLLSKDIGPVLASQLKFNELFQAAR